MKFKNIIKISLPFLLICGAIALVHFCNGWAYVSWESLKEIHLDLVDFVLESPFNAAIIFFLGYILFALTLLPGLVILDLVGGFLFPQPISTLLITLGCAVGAVIQFIVAKYAFKDLMMKKKRETVEKVQNAFEKNQTNYLLAVRMVPIFPFGVLNFTLATLKIPSGKFFWTTFVGSIPLVFFYAEAGRGLGKILGQEGPITLATIFNGPIISALVGLCLLVLIPVIVKGRRKARD